MIELKHVSKVYESGAGQVHALRDVTFTLPSSGLVFVLGKSGCGKSTLLNLLGGMDSPTQGEIALNGTSIVTGRERDLDVYRNNCVGFVFQEFNLLEGYSAGANIALALQLKKQKADRAQVDAALRRVGLVDGDGNTLYERKISQLSGGQKQRVAVARALVKDPEIILADEPTGALDSETSASLFALLKELSQDKLIVVVTHDRESAERYGDRIIELHDGSVISDRTKREPEEKPASDKNGAKGGLPLASVLRMGLFGFRKKTVRLVLSVLLAVISLTVFVFSTSALSTDMVMAVLRTSYDNGAETVTLSVYVEYDEKVTYPNGQTFDRQDAHEDYFSQEQLDALRAETDIFPVFEPMEVSASLYLATGELDTPERLNPYNYFSRGLISRYVVVDGSVKAEELGMSAVTANSRLPVTAEEIALTDYQADMFIRFGYQEPSRGPAAESGAEEKGEIVPIGTPEDLLGLTVNGRTIVGIFSTEESLEWLKGYDRDFNGVYLGNYTDGFYVDVDGYFYDWSRGDHMIKTALIGGEGLEQTQFTKVLYRLTGNAERDRALIDSLCYEDVTVDDSSNMTYQFNKTHTVNVTSAYSGFTDAAWMFTDDLFLVPALVISIILAVFSALLLMNFLLASTEARRREIGILRALGGGKADAVKVCLAESGMIAILDLVLSLVAGGIVCVILNHVYRCSLFSIGLLPALYLILLCFGAAALATVLPALRISRRKPVEILREK